MATVLRTQRSVNSEALAAAWHALMKRADKQANRDDLTPGGCYAVDLTIAGDIDGCRIEQPVVGTLTVGHNFTKATSATPTLDHVVGAILGKLNEATRNAVLRELPEQFAANGCALPDVPNAIAERTAAMLVALRAKKQSKCRGAVKFLPAAEGAGEEADSASLAVVG